MSRFDYIVEKVLASPKSAEPFEHIYIADLFSDSDFAEIVATPDINIPAAADDDDLFGKLADHGYQIIEFPGCIVDKQAYLDWHRSRGRDTRVHSACEGFGMTLRLTRPSSGILKELDEFLASERFNRAIASRFDVEFEDCTVDGGIQKYLDGYEISPHPDIRRKAATFMVNINPHQQSEDLDHHTHYLRMKPEYEYVRRFWESAPTFDRSWVPWDWCETIKTQPKNNSIVLFSPSNETVHGVKTNYNHLNGQRTQLYGNLWYKAPPKLRKAEWEQLSRGEDDLTILAASKVEQPIAWQLKNRAKGVVNAVLGRKKESKDFTRNYY